MAKILHFKTPRDNVIEALEKLLQHAKDGDLTGFIFAAKCPDGNIATSWTRDFTKEEAQMHTKMLDDLSEVEEKLFFL